MRSQLEAGPAATRAAAVAERQGLRAKWRNLPKAGKVAIAIALLGALAAAVPPLAPVVVTILIIPFLVKAAPTWAKKFEEEEQKRLKAAQQIICPHCGNRGSVTVRDTSRKEGNSGGKATGAVLTGGLSILATGLSRKQAGKSLTCSNCKMHWFVASV